MKGLSINNYLLTIKNGGKKMKKLIFAVLITLTVLTFTWIAVAADKGGDDLLAPYETGEREFIRYEIGDLIVFFHQRMVGNAIVEKDFIVYQFDKSTEEFVDKKVYWREDVPGALPPIAVSKEQAESMVKGKVQFSELYIISPGSDVFPLDPTPVNPCWIVRSVDNGKMIVTIIDAVTGQFLGYGVSPPWEGFSLAGPNWGSCDPYYSAWANNAKTWFDTMGYSTEMVDTPPDAKVQSHIQSPSTVMFYELAHGGSTSFHNICPDSESITATEIETWIAGYRKMPFSFLGSCGAMCDTGDNTLSYELRKGSTDSTATVGYCGMSESYCSSCWGVSIPWQTKLFDYMNQGYTVSYAVNRALADYPQCINTTYGNCMRFAGDSYFKVGSRDEIMGVGGTWSTGIWYRNLASQTWHKPYSITPSGAIAVGDVTGDGKADMVSVWGSGLWYQNGATWGWTQEYSKAPDRIAVGDINGDGYAEIMGVGGTWSAGSWYRDVHNGIWYKPYGFTPSGAIAVGDVTGDGKADMVSVWGSGLWYQNGATWGWTQEYSKAPDRIAVGDINGN